MKRILAVLIALSGAALGVLIFNLFLVSYVPAYHEAFENAVMRDANIPTVIVNKDGEIIPPRTIISDEPVALTPIMTTDAEDYSIDATDSETLDTEKEIIEKSYYNDFETGEGYWVITYSDGSTEIEE